MLQDRLKVLVFVRPSFSPLFWLSAVQSTINPPFPFDTIAWMLRMPGRKSREYARYSPALLSPLLFYIPGCCNQTLEPRSWSTPEVPTTTCRSPTTRSSSEVPRKDASPFRSCCHICASLLKVTLYFMSVLRYYGLYDLCIWVLMTPGF